uniref:Putative beta beta-carotene n=1 Tax=Lutzomyia longipalpis TaxID=7200 RepID=A0A1B0CCI0_LUTLO
NERNLETTKRVNLSREIGIVHHTSHPHVLSNGCVYNLGTIVTKFGPKYCIVEFPQGKDFNEAKIVASIFPRRKLNPSYMHTFGITENFFILIEQPLAVSVKLMSQTLWKNDPLIDSLRWFGKKTTKFHILSRKSGHTERSFYAETFFFFHVINSYEEDNHIVVDICCYENPDIIKGMYLDSFRTMQTNPNYSSMFQAKPLRFVLPLNEKEDQKNCNLIKLNGSKAQAKIQKNGRILCIPEELCETSCDLPRINYSNNSGQNYRYFYAMSSDFSNGGNIIKVDVKNKTQTTWSEKNCYPGEPVFLSAPNATSEDDGVVLSVLLRGNNQENHVELLVLCAKDLKVLARCEFITPSPVPRCIIKVDVKNKTQTTWSEKNCYPGEPVFLSAPNATSEDDGVVLSVLLRGNNQENHVELLVLCAKDLKVLARCEFITPSPVPSIPPMYSV